MTTSLHVSTDVPPADRHARTPPVTATLLGTGTSTGVPVIGCDCEVCTSADPRDTRTRCTCYVEVGDMGLLIDTGPDFRAQALREDIDRIDAVCYTHHHFDHVVGLDDLRPFFRDNRRVVPCYAHAETAVPVDPILLMHGDVPVYGYRLGRFAYLTDASAIPEASYEQLQGIDTLVLDGLCPRPHPTHFSFEEAVAAASGHARRTSST